MMPLRPSRRQAAFSLIELMVVILIIAILMALALVGAGYARTKAAENKTKLVLETLKTALERYYADNQAYPEAGQSGHTRANAERNSADLYAALTGDTDRNGRIEGDEKKNGTYLEELLAPSGTGSMQNMVGTTGTGANARRFIIDGFGEAINYFNPSGSRDNMNNTAYDLWSYGTDATNDRSQPDRWITNWK